MAKSKKQNENNKKSTKMIIELLTTNGFVEKWHLAENMYIFEKDGQEVAICDGDMHFIFD